MKLLFEWLETGAAVLTSTPRQALQLRWQFDRRQAASGKAGWRAPEILPLASWLETTWQQAVVDGAPSGLHRLLAPLQARLLWRAVSAEAVGDTAAPRAVDGLAQAAHRLAAEWAIDDPALQQAAVTADERLFVEMLAAYRRRCSSTGAISPADWCWLLADDLAAGRLRPGHARIVFCGFATWPRSLDRLLAALGLSGADARQHQPVLAGRTLARAHYPDTRAEQAAIVQWAADQLERRGGRSLGIVLPNATEQGPGLSRALLDIVQPDWRARPAPQRPVVMSGDPEPLARVEPVASALAILALSSPTIDYRELAGLLRSPCIRGSNTEADARARLDLALRRSTGPRVNHWQLQRLIREHAPEFARSLAQLLDATRASPARQDPAAWVQWLDRQLGAFGWPGDAAPEPSEERTRRRWRELLDQVAGCAEFTGPLNLAEFRQLLTELAMERGGGSEQGAAGVAVLSPEEALGQIFDGLWIAGLHADAWPPPRRPNPLLPLALQRAAGIPEASPTGLAGQAQRLLEGLCEGSELAMLSCADSEGEVRLTPSPLLAGLPDQAPAHAARPGVQERLFWSAELEEVETDPAPPVQDGERVGGGARLLQLQALCPARAFFELRLGARELEAPVAGISAQQRGLALHRAAETLYRALHAAGLSPAEAAAQDLVSEAVADALRGLAPAGDALAQATAELEGQRIDTILRRLLAWDAARPPFRFLAAETPAEIQLGPLPLKLRSDRVDELPGGGWLVIDYKTGDNVRLAWQGERPAEPQLPLYAVAARDRVRALAIVQLTRRELKVNGVAEDPECLPCLKSVSQFSGGAMQGWDEQLSAWHRNLGRLAEEFAAGSCLIDLTDPGLAQGQFAPLTRALEAVGPTAA